MQHTLRPRIRSLVRAGMLFGAAALLTAACSSSGSSGSPSDSTTSGGSTAAAASIAPFQTALQQYYKGTFTSPPTTAPTPPKGVKLWVISCGQASAGCAGPVAAVKAAADRLGWTVNVFDGNFGVGDAYNGGLRQAIAAQATAIITVGVDCNLAKTGYLAAQAAHIPVVGANSFDCSDPALHDGSSLFSATVQYTPQAPTAAATLEEVGRAKADWIIVHTDGKAQVINLNFSGITGGIYTNDGFVSEMAKCTTCKIVKTINFTPADTSDGVLKQEWASALAQYPNANAGTVLSDGIITQDDLAQALQSDGRTKTFALVGEEGYATNVQLVTDGDGEDAGATYDSNWLSWGAVDTLIRVLDHKPIVNEGMGVQVWDATHNLPAPDTNYGAPVDYQKIYETAWGV